eukprot:COSAG05_NODE_1211_length_5498_cov_120.273014_2_plen_391_part_00
MYRNRQHLDTSDISVQHNHETTQTDPDITDSTGSVYRDLNRAAVRGVQGLVRKNRLLSRQIRRRLAKAAEAQTLPEYVQQSRVTIAQETELKTRRENWDSVLHTPSMEFSSSIDKTRGASSVQVDDSFSDLDLSDRVRGGGAGSDEKRKKKKMKKTGEQALHGANKRMAQGARILDAIKNVDTHAEKRKAALRQKKQQDTMADVCYHCKQPGHWKIHCPELATMKEELLDAANASTPDSQKKSTKTVVEIDVASDMIAGYPETPWGRGMAMRKKVKPTTLERIQGIPHFDDQCYYCKGFGHWKVTQGEDTCPKWLEENKPPNADKYTGVEAGLGEVGSATAIARVRRGKELWQKTKTAAVIGTVLTAQLEQDKAQQVQDTFAFLVRLLSW